MHKREFEDQSEQKIMLVETNEDDEDQLRIDQDQIFDITGGFGKFQWLLLAYATIAYSGINFYVYNFAYLQLVPALMCKYSGESDYRD